MALIGKLRWAAGNATNDSAFTVPIRIMSKASQLPSQVTIGIRPEDVIVLPYAAAPSGAGVPSQVKLVEYMGSMNIYVIQAGTQQVVATTAPDFYLEPGTNVYLQPNVAKIHFFDPKTGTNLTL